jgi:phage virion morphogenesis protein
MADIGEYMLRQTDNRFRNEEAPDGTPWAPLATATLERKARRGKIRKILQEEGNLRTTLSYRASAQEVELGSIQPYSTYHQFGTSRMVARPFLGVSDEDREEIEAIVADWVQG